MPHLLTITPVLPIQVVFGRWLIDGYPSVILFDIGSGAKHLEAWKDELYDLSRIAIPWHDRESNDAVIFGNLCTWFIADVSLLGGDSGLGKRHGV